MGELRMRFGVSQCTLLYRVFLLFSLRNSWSAFVLSFYVFHNKPDHYTFDFLHIIRSFTSFIWQSFAYPSRFDYFAFIFRMPLSFIGHVSELFEGAASLR